MKGYEKIIIIGDQHIPYDDKKTLKIMFNFIKNEKPDTLIINGDLLDFYDLSSFDKDLVEEGGLQSEIDKGYEILKKYRKLLPKSKIILTTSNHMEKRLEKYKKRLGKSVSSLRYLSIPEMLNLKELNIESKDFVRYKKFMVYHGDIVRKHSGYSARATLENKGKSVFINHVHRLGSHYKTDEGGTHVAVECGCLCSLNPEYIDGVPNWQQGFVIIFRDKKTNWYQHYLIPIINNKFIWNNEVY
jgi:predicted phosphodiesterase